jgi:hypothetical protein
MRKLEIHAILRTLDKKGKEMKRKPPPCFAYLSQIPVERTGERIEEEKSPESRTHKPGGSFETGYQNRNRKGVGTGIRIRARNV